MPTPLYMPRFGADDTASLTSSPRPATSVTAASAAAPVPATSAGPSTASRYRRRESIQASSSNVLVPANGQPPASGRGQPMRLAHILSTDGPFPVWVDFQNNEVVPCAKS